MSAEGEIIKGVTDWNKLTVAQLKGALARRGLNSDGGKEELVQRLQEYDTSEGVNSMETEEEEKEEPEEIAPMLMKAALKNGASMVMALKTVIINPFRQEMMQDSSFLSSVETCKFYTIKKTQSGVSAAQLFFETVDKGDAALTELKANLQGDDVEIYHPRHYDKTRIEAIQIPSDFEELTEEKPPGFLWERLLVLENLPDMLNTEEKLYEFFPEALQAVSFQFDPTAKGIAILEFATLEEADDYLKSVGDQIKLEDADIKVTKYSVRNNKWHAVIGRPKWKDSVDSEKKTLDNDEDRIALNRELTQMRIELDSIQQSDECFGQDKLAKLHEQQKKIREATYVLTGDTLKRLRNKELTMPEEEEEMQEKTKILISKKKGGVASESEESCLNLLAELDKKLLAVQKEYKALSNAIKSKEKFLSQDAKQERAAKAKNQPILAHVQNVSGNKKKQQQDQLLKKAQMQVKFHNQQATANLMKTQAARVGQPKKGNKKKNNKRPGGKPNNDMEEPPVKKQQMNQKKQPMNQNKPQMNQKKQQMNQKTAQAFGFRSNQNFGRGGSGGMRGGGARGGAYGGGRGGAFGGGFGGYRGGMRGGQNMMGGSGNSIELIEGITSALTDKMMQLEEMQKQTLQTQAALMHPPQGGASFGARTPLGGGGMGSSSYGSGSYGVMGGDYSSNQSDNYSNNYGNYEAGSGYGSGNTGTGYGSENTGTGYGSGNTGSGYGSGNYGSGYGGGYGKGKQSY